MCSPARAQGLLYIPACMLHISAMWQPTGSFKQLPSWPPSLVPNQAAHASRPCLLKACLSRCRPTADLQLMTYRSYLDTFLLPFDMGTGHDVDEYNTRIKHQRNKLKRHFTEEGQAGEMFRCAATGMVGI